MDSFGGRGFVDGETAVDEILTVAQLLAQVEEATAATAVIENGKSTKKQVSFPGGCV